MTDAPKSRAVIAAASPDTPAPMMTTSAERSHLMPCACALFAAPQSATAPTPAALFDRKALRLTACGAPSGESRSAVLLVMFCSSRRSVPGAANLDFAGAGVKTAPTLILRSLRNLKAECESRTFQGGKFCVRRHVHNTRFLDCLCYRGTDGGQVAWTVARPSRSQVRSG